ncbi:MAG: RNA pseudouridine synthase [Candidatus Omnitrophota bacterium]|nr:MAG: RNA pseudouridine synthase [Candidatus Omnitrophota bacterium]
MREAFKIVFEDDFVIVLNKIVKILVQPSPKKEPNTLTALLEKKIKSKVYPCHRLDRETTGLIIYAKNKEIQRQVMEEFKKGVVKKKYIAFARGRFIKKKGIRKDYIIDQEGRRFGEKPKKAEMIFKVLEEIKGFSVVELEPLTGRTNQLRIQLAKEGNPILGERKYAFGKDFKINFKRLALHACFLSFIHPVSKERLNLKIGLANDMKDFLQKKKREVQLCS